MKGVVFPGGCKVEMREFPDPTPGPGEVVIEMKASGMCGSDLKVYRSPGGGPAMAAALGLGGDGKVVVAGHEPCGVVVSRGPEVPEVQAPVGGRVMVHHYKGCGICRSCRSGWAQLCGEGSVVYGITDHGAHAPYMKIPANTLVGLPDTLSFAEGAAISCGTGTAYGALRRLQITGGQTLAVFGQGPVGLSGTMLAASMGARVIAVDIAEERLDLAKEFGADELVNSADTDPVEALKQLTNGEGVDLALECTGVEAARSAAVNAVRTWGSVCMVGEGGDLTLNISRQVIRKQLTIIGSWTFSTFGQEDCARFVAENQVPVDRLITHHFKLDDAEDAYRLFDTQTTGKGVFDF